jgi:hypothetical protein
MKIARKAKWKLVGLATLSLVASMSSLKAEAVAFHFTAPTDALVKISCDYLARSFAPSAQEQKVVFLARKDPRPQ